MDELAPPASITIDVDGVRHYHAIHGLPPPRGDDPIVTIGVRRFLDVCSRFNVRATLFVVTADACGDMGTAVLEVLRQAHRRGNELASHSHAHAYDLAVRNEADIQSDVVRSIDVLTEITGARPRGFRAPGYNVSERLLDTLESAGFAYDSSVMPSMPYVAARAAAIGLHRISGRTSASRVGDLRAGLTPRAPYVPKRGAWHRPAQRTSEGRHLLEVPISTLPLGLPWLGTTLASCPLPLGAACTALADHHADQKPLVLELHAIDFCSADDGFDARLVELQPGLRVPLSTRLARLESALRIIMQTRRISPLHAVVETLRHDVIASAR